MYRFLHRHLLLPGFETLYKRRKTLRYLRDLEQSQWRTAAELGEMQTAALRALLAHAAANCPYYREAWREQGLDPAKVHSPDDFARWPTLDRATILAIRMRMRSELPGTRLIGKTTGGSTGEPLRFDMNLDSNDRRCAMSHRGYAWAGAELGTKLLYLWGAPLGTPSRMSRLKDVMYHRLYRRKVLNSFELTEARMPEFLAAHNRYRPDVLVAYTNPLYEFARMLDERGLRPIPPGSIIVGAEKLYPFQRQLIGRVFQAPVFETYGSREFMLMAAECDKHQGLHLSQEHLLIEVLDDDGAPTLAGQEGNVVVTDLYNYGMPFIRYVTGDRAVAGWGTCPCGRGLLTMKSVTGRVLDTLRTSDGRRVPGEFFVYLLKDFLAVKRFQVVQRQPDHVELRVVANSTWNDADRGTIETLARGLLGPGTRFEIVRVEDIALTGAGKLRVVVNLCGDRAADATAN